VRRRLVLLSFSLLATTGCGGSQSTTTTVSTTTTERPTMTLTVFRLAGGRLRAEAVRVPGTQAVAGAALQALGVDSTVTLAGGTATVDLSTADQTTAAEIVCTLTHFPAIKRVDVAGRKNLTCDDFESLLPIIFVTSPAAGAEVGPTFSVTGSASVFEATFVVQLIQHGKVVFVRQAVMASEGAPGRGAFATSLTGRPGAATVHAFAPSAADGTPQHIVDVPVTIR
jgi:hypothetical protein